MIFSEERTRKQIEKLYKTNPEIHVNVSLSKPKLVLKNAAAKIVGVYLHIFYIEENSTGRVRRHAIRYADVMPSGIEILELNE